MAAIAICALNDRANDASIATAVTTTAKLTKPLLRAENWRAIFPPSTSDLKLLAYDAMRVDLPERSEVRRSSCGRQLYSSDPLPVRGEQARGRCLGNIAPSGFVTILVHARPSH